MENKKIRNATPLTYDNIKFKSKLEATCYKTLIDNGLNPQYEQKVYTLFEGFTPTVSFYTKNRFKGKNKKLISLSLSTVIDMRNIEKWKYTPDFYFEYNKYIIHIEVKGFRNDVSSYKIKIFRSILEEYQKEDTEHVYELWEIYTKKQLLDCINHIKDNEKS